MFTRMYSLPARTVFLNGSLPIIKLCQKEQTSSSAFFFFHITHPHRNYWCSCASFSIYYYLTSHFPFSSVFFSVNHKEL
jgi:hypothetical protein